MPQIRVLLVDDHPVVREGLKALISTQPNLIVVGEAGDGLTAVSLANSLDPDLAVVEAALPDTNGAEFMTRLRKAAPDRKIVVLTGQEDKAYHQLLLQAGAEACVLKNSPIHDLLQTLQTVAGVCIYHDHAPVSTVVDGAVMPQLGSEPLVASLSERESEVVRLIALGYSNKEIASLLELSVKTIETYKARSMEKLGIRSRVDIVQYASKRGWLDKM